MAITAGEVQVISEFVDKTKPGLDRMEKNVGKTAKATEAGMTRVQSAIQAVAFDQLADGAGALAERSGDVIQFAGSFEILTEKAGLAGDVMLGKTRDATQGLITDMDLMRQSNESMLLGIVKTEDEMAELAGAAITLGRATGRDAVGAVDDLIGALGRGSTELLDNLGVSVKAGEAQKIYAERLGKTASQLTDAEKKQAFMTIALEKVRAKSEELGGIQLNTNDTLTQTKVAAQNAIDGLSGILGPIAAVGGGLLQAGSQVATFAAVSGVKFGAVATAARAAWAAIMGPVGLAIGVGVLAGVLLGKLVGALSKSEEATVNYADAVKKAKDADAAHEQQISTKTLAALKAELEAMGDINEMTSEQRRRRTNLIREIQKFEKGIRTSTKATKELSAEEKRRKKIVDDLRDSMLEQFDLDLLMYEQEGKAIIRKQAVKKSIDDITTALSDLYDQGSRVPGVIDDAVAAFEPMLLPPPGKPPIKVLDEGLGDVKKQLTSVVAQEAGSFGGIITSLVSGDWVGAAIQGAQKAFGFIKGLFGGGGSKNNETVQKAREEAQRQLEEMEQKQRDAEEAARSAAETVAEAWRDVADAVAEGELPLDMLHDKLVEHFGPAGAAVWAGSFKEMLGDLEALEGQLGQLQGLAGFVDQFLPQTALEKFQETGVLSEAAVTEYAAQGGDPEALRAFGEALGQSNAWNDLVEALQGASEEDRGAAEANLLAMAEALGIDTTQPIGAVIEAGNEMLETELGGLASALKEDVKGAILEVKAEIHQANIDITGKLESVEQAIANKEFVANFQPVINVNVDRDGLVDYVIEQLPGRADEQGFGT